MYVECICPLCERKHRVELNIEWTGNGMMRKFCNGCKFNHKHYGYKVEVRTEVKIAFSVSGNDYWKPGILTKEIRKFKKGD